MSTGADAPLDVAVIGGGPAGLAAALWLARYRRRVAVFDDDTARNEAAWAVHGYPGVPDVPPGELRQRLRQQALGAGAEFRAARVRALDGAKDAFRVHTDAGPPTGARRLLLAFGRRDRIPTIPGARELYGTALFHCPDCDGPSVAAAPAAVIGGDRSAAGLALYLLTWTPTVALLTHGHRARFPDHVARTLRRHEIRVYEPAIRRLERRGPGTVAAELADGRTVEASALFCRLGSEPAAPLAHELGCRLTHDGHLRTDGGRQTTVPGVFAAGDLAGLPHLAIHAAADGVQAALALHRSLLPPDFEV